MLSMRKRKFSLEVVHAGRNLTELSEQLLWFLVWCSGTCRPQVLPLPCKHKVSRKHLPAVSRSENLTSWIWQSSIPGMLAEILDVYRWEAEVFHKADMGLQMKNCVFQHSQDCSFKTLCFKRQQWKICILTGYKCVKNCLNHAFSKKCIYFLDVICLKSGKTYWS